MFLERIKQAGLGILKQLFVFIGKFLPGKLLILPLVPRFRPEREQEK